jgi:hypothetical protein
VPAYRPHHLRLAAGLLLALGVLLSGCGGGSDGRDEPSDGQAGLQGGGVPDTAALDLANLCRQQAARVAALTQDDTAGMVAADASHCVLSSTAAEEATTAANVAAAAAARASRAGASRQRDASR